MKPVSEMTNDEFNTFVVEYMLQGWIPLKMYLKIFPTETRNSIDLRLHRGLWQKGVHYNSPKGGLPWVNLIEIRKWAASQET